VLPFLLSLSLCLLIGLLYGSAYYRARHPQGAVGERAVRYHA